MNHRNKGFTLIELLVVIAIIGLLATIATNAVQSAREKAKIARAQHEIKLIYDAINMLANDTNLWPGEQDVNVAASGGGNEICSDGCPFGLSDSNSGLTANNGNYLGWEGPYRESIPLDPWNNEYFFDTDYQNNGDTVVALGSYGPNGQGNNDYDSDDVVKILIK